MKKKSQKEIVVEQLKLHGKVSRNFCLSLRITRLAAIVLSLKESGYDLIGKDEGSDYVYLLVAPPTKTVAAPVQLPNGNVDYRTVQVPLFT